jgi:hypothetical protein
LQFPQRSKNFIVFTRSFRVKFIKYSNV